MKNKIYGISIFSLMLVIVLFYISNIYILEPTVYYGYIENAFNESKVNNIVTSIYLNYRVFDTLFEALLLLVSVVAINQFSVLNPQEILQKKTNFNYDDVEHYTLPRYMMSIIYPLFVVFGIYVISKGADSPGGGFQGGAILAALLMSRSIVGDIQSYNEEFFFVVEKYIYLIIVLAVMIYLTVELPKEYNRTYILIMNGLIGFKVYSGFSYIFLNFVKDES